ncbi:MAG: pilus assembly protein PilP, partial [Gammaproteobacteria bacterium]|nr:pilus assembly protein PilP [Gammaproteobacteria bacterium]
MMGNKELTTKLSAIIACGLLLAGCNQGLGDLQQYVQQVKSQPPGRIEPIPEFQPYQNFEYTSHDLRDPFKLVDFRRPEENPEDIQETASGPRP